MTLGNTSGSGTLTGGNTGGTGTLTTGGTPGGTSGGTTGGNSGSAANGSGGLVLASPQATAALNLEASFAQALFSQLMSGQSGASGGFGGQGGAVAPGASTVPIGMQTILASLPNLMQAFSMSAWNPQGASGSQRGNSGNNVR